MATVQTKGARVSTSPGANVSYAVPLAIVTTLFFMWGGITSLNDVLIPHFKSLFGLTFEQAARVQLVFFFGYFIFSLPSGKLIQWLGYKRAMVAGLVVMALGTLTFIPAAMVPSYPLFLVAFFIMAAGMTILQTSANPYVTVLGRPETASSRLNLTQAFNSLGTTVFPKVGGLLILSAAAITAAEFQSMDPAARHAFQLREAAAVKMPYLALTIILVLLAVVIALSKLPAIATLEEDPTDEAGGGSIWHHRQAVLGAIGIFTYVGAEVAIGSFLISYFGYLVGMPEKTASGYVSFYWGGAMIGRFVGSAVLQRIRTGKLLMLNAFVAALLVIVSMFTNAHVAMWSIIAVGLFNSVMFPSIFTLGVDGLGKLTNKGSALLIAAIVGGAIIPWVQGIVIDNMNKAMGPSGIHHSFFIPVLCYLYIAYFAYDRLKAENANPRAA